MSFKEIIVKAQNLGIKGIIAAGVIVIGMSSFQYNQGGVYTRLQQPLIGHSWVKEEGYFFKMPFISRTKEFNKNGTIASTDNQPLIEASGITVVPTVAQFADSYEMRFEWSMRYQLPLVDTDLEEMYQAIKNQDNLLANTLMPFGQTMFTDSVNQMLGGEFAQGGKNALRTLVDNQTQNGMYQTKVVRTPVKRDAGEGSNNVLGGASTDMLITEVKYLEDKNGKKLRTPLSISAYNLKIVPNSFQIVENQAIGRLVDYIKTKQDNQKIQIDQDEKQKNLAKKAQTAQLQGELNLVTRTNVLNIKKEEAIINMQQKVAQAKLQADKEIVERQKVADLAIIDKNTELQQAKAEEGIQRANDRAATYEANKIKKVGFALAAVAKAKLAAKQSNKEIYLAELSSKVKIQQAVSMENTKLDAPKSVIINNGKSGNTSTSDLLNVKLVQDVTNLAK